MAACSPADQGGDATTSAPAEATTTEPSASGEPGLLGRVNGLMRQLGWFASAQTAPPEMLTSQDPVAALLVLGVAAAGLVTLEGSARHERTFLPRRVWR